ncbi:MAG: cupin domain-containing protein [Candidatus Thiodiazotropha endolucinida]
MKRWPISALQTPSLVDDYRLAVDHSDTVQSIYIRAERFDHLTGQQLVEHLPKILMIDSWADEEGSWFHNTLRFIAQEARALRPGGETVITHLGDHSW